MGKKLVEGAHVRIKALDAMGTVQAISLAAGKRYQVRRDDGPVAWYHYRDLEIPTLKTLMATFPTRCTLVFASSVAGDSAPPSGLPVDFAVDDPPPKEVVLVMQFSQRGFGFGEISLKQTPEGLFVDTERMSLSRVKRFFSALLDQAVTDLDQDPTRHAMFNQAMGRQCSTHCLVCRAAGTAV